MTDDEHARAIHSAAQALNDAIAAAMADGLIVRVVAFDLGLPGFDATQQVTPDIIRPVPNPEAARLQFQKAFQS